MFRPRGGVKYSGLMGGGVLEKKRKKVLTKGRR